MALEIVRVALVSSCRRPSHGLGDNLCQRRKYRAVRADAEPEREYRGNGERGAAAKGAGGPRRDLPASARGTAFLKHINIGHGEFVGFPYNV